MNRKVNYAIMFLTGAVVGASGGYLFAKKKYEQIANEEIDSVKESYEKLNKKDSFGIDAIEAEENIEYVYTPDKSLTELNEDDSKKLSEEKGESPMDYMNKFTTEENPLENEKTSIKDDEQITNIFDKYGQREVTPKKTISPVVPTPYVGNDPIYVIDPNEYGSLDNYNLVSLTLTKDGYLLDDQNEIIDDPVGAIGDCLAFMGEYEDDAVHVRNDVRQCDYEVLQDLRTLEQIRVS